LSVRLRYTNFDYHFGIFKLFSPYIANMKRRCHYRICCCHWILFTK